MTSKPNSYHHGNLKSALVNTYIELLSTTEQEKLSLRKLATHLSVAPTAVYNHFADKDALMVAVRTRCLHHFADYLEHQYQETGSPESNFIQLGKTYFRYSIVHQDYFRIVFQTPKNNENITQDLIDAGMRAEEKLRNTVIALYQQHEIPNTQYTEGLGAFACWALAHGITSLAAMHVNRAACNNGRWPQEFMLDNEQSVDSVFDAVGEILVSGILAKMKTFAIKSN